MTVGERRLPSDHGSRVRGDGGNGDGVECVSG